jgi:hypothetical protein
MSCAPFVVRGFLEKSGCSKIVRSSFPEKAPRRRSSATPHKVVFEDSGEMAAFQQPVEIKKPPPQIGAKA